MRIFNGGFAMRQLAILLIMAIAACKRDLATEPASPDAVLRIEALSPTELEGTVGESVAPVPTVVVRNETGQAVPGTKVVFIPLNQSDSVSGDFVTNRIVITDSRGLATAGDWKLGKMSGLHGLAARLVDEHYSGSDSGRVVAFHAEAHAAAPASLSISDGDNQLGLPADEMDPPIVRVTDRFGNNADGVIITFTIGGGGSLAKTQDQARRGSASPGMWTMGPNPGLNTVVASAPGLNSVTFSARALDVGAVTWYDLVPQSVRLLVSGSLALCEDGTFEMVTVETSDALPGEWRVRQLGKYTLAGSVIVLTFPEGVIRQGTLADHRLSFMHKSPNWVNSPLEDWTFVKRQEPIVPPGDKLSISGVMSPLHQSILIGRQGAIVPDAEVTVNGTRIPYCCGNLYSGDLPAAVSVGGKLSLKVAADGRTFEASGIVTGIPVITAPAPGSTFSSSDPIRLEWTIDTEPDRFEVCLNCFENSIDRETHTVGSTREFVIQPGALVDWGSGTPIAVYARRSNFLKSSGSADGTADVLFVAKSRDVLVFIKD